MRESPAKANGTRRIDRMQNNMVVSGREGNGKGVTAPPLAEADGSGRQAQVPSVRQQRLRPRKRFGELQKGVERQHSERLPSPRPATKSPIASCHPPPSY